MWVSGDLADIKIDSKLVFKHQIMFVSGVGMYFEFISSHPPGCTARSLIDNCIIINSTHGIYIFSLTISLMINRTLVDLFNNVFSASFDNQKVGKHYLTSYLTSGASKNLNKIWVFSIRFLTVQWDSVDE